MIRITEIFYSLQGETNTTGLPTVFIRLTGCPLRCRWCDTEYAFKGGNLLSIDEILNKVAKYAPKYVTVTGGEPLAQKTCCQLLTSLADHGYEVSLETSGAISLKDVDSRIVKVMDLKAPASGEAHRNLYDNIYLLKKTDQLKFVIANRGDYDWSVSKIIEYDLTNRVSDVLFSPVSEQMPPEQLAGWILEDRLHVRFQLQLHRILWGNLDGV